MDDFDGERVRKAWNQNAVPVILRRTRGRLRVRLPFETVNPLWLATTKAWLAAFGRLSPEWDEKLRYWEVPAAWFNRLVDKLLKTHGSLYIIQPHREQEKCASRCWNAEGHECQCSCLGKNHGQGKMGSWLEISETFATRWGDETMACRLMKLR